MIAPLRRWLADRAQARAERRERRARGLCVACGEVQAMPGCDECFDCGLVRP